MIGHALVLQFEKRDFIVSSECVGTLRRMILRLRDWLKGEGFLNKTPWYESLGPDGEPVLEGMVRAVTTALILLFYEQGNALLSTDGKASLASAARDVVIELIKEEIAQN